MSDLRKIRCRIDFVYKKKFDELYCRYRRKELSSKEYDFEDLIVRIEHLYLMGCLSNQEFEEYYIDPYKFWPLGEDKSNSVNENKTIKIPEQKIETQDSK
eukprot:TRINITY_DN1450_c0_g1_i2.p3 TRINITY_DN1450_c0_g1~~TRINITY_DN1450_c0_g1_i2.p3  ORF type:complete len:100 (-),score=8.77 TRINITY_DN1450_c0_g1_i2:51-350(-)